MLNHATMKVMEAEQLKTASEEEHAKRAAFFTKAEQEVQHLEKKLRKFVQKSRPYFEEKDAFNHTLESQKNRVHKLQDEVRVSKLEYAKSLRALEDISESIHARRQLRMRYKMDVTKIQMSRRDGSADGRSGRFVDHSELDFNLDEVDTFSKDICERRQEHARVSSVSSSSCYGGSGSLDDLASTEQDFSSTRSVSAKSELNDSSSVEGKMACSTSTAPFSKPLDISTGNKPLKESHSHSSNFNS